MTEQIEQPGLKNAKVEQDLAKYLEFADPKKLSQKEIADFRANLETWDQQGKVEAIRTAGVSQKENRDNFNKRHILLSQEFLTKNNSKEGLEFKIDFKKNQLAEWRVGLGDMLPPNITEIKLKRADGTSVIGVRTQNPATGRIGYYEKDALKSKQYEYLACHTGDTCEILATYTITDSGLGDPRTYREHIEIYTNNAAREDHSDTYELDHYDPSTREVLTPAQSRERKAAAVTRKSKEELARISTEVTGERKNTNDWMRESGNPLSKDPDEKKRFEAWYSQNIIRRDPVNGGPIKFMGVELKAGINKKILPFLMQAAKDIEAAGIDYKFYSAESVAVRAKRTNPNSPSRHCWGSAIDLNARTNMPRKRGDMPMEVVNIMKKYGFYWGGDWSGYKDDMHFQFKYVPEKVATKLLKDEGIRYWNALGLKATTPSAPKPEKSSDRVGPLSRSEVAVTYTQKRFKPDVMTQDNRHNLKLMEVDPSKLNAINKYLDHFERNRARYEYVAERTGYPAIAILCIHRMEVGPSLSFDTYLHNGQKLGKPTTFVPKGVFFRKGEGQWERAAIHALGGDILDDNGKDFKQYKQYKRNMRKMTGLSANSNDIASMLTMLEAYNGLGYRNKGKVSPYVYGATNIYEKGLFVRDGKYDPNREYKGIGAAAILEVYFNREKYRSANRPSASARATSPGQQTVPRQRPAAKEAVAEGNDTTRGLSGDALIRNEQFRDRLKQVAANIGCSPEDLIAIFTLESNVNPQAYNKLRAAGLIQWIPRTAKSMYRMNTVQISKMSGLQQLDMVESYFKRQGRNRNIDDLYLSVLYPYAKNKPDDYIMGSQRGMAYAQEFANWNPFNGKDKATGKARLVRKSDVLRKIRKIRQTHKFVKLYQQLEPNA